MCYDSYCRGNFCRTNIETNKATEVSSVCDIAPGIPSLLVSMTNRCLPAVSAPRKCSSTISSGLSGGGNASLVISTNFLCVERVLHATARFVGTVRDFTQHSFIIFILCEDYWVITGLRCGY